MARFACDTLQINVSASGVAEITLQRPHVHNALNEQMIAELTALLVELNADPKIRLLCLQGAGKSFCAGADLTWMQKMIAYSARENLNDALKLSQMLEALYNFSKPTLAILHGVIYGGGIGLAACCDIAIAHADSTFCLSETKLGLVPATIAPYVAQAIGMRALRYLSFTALPASATQLQQWGLVQDIAISMEELAARKQFLIENILCNGPQALMTAKQLVKRVQLHSMDDALSTELAELIASIRVGQEAQERMLRFLEQSFHSHQK